MHRFSFFLILLLAAPATAQRRLPNPPPVPDVIDGLDDPKPQKPEPAPVPKPAPKPEKPKGPTLNDLYAKSLKEDVPVVVFNHTSRGIGVPDGWLSQETAMDTEPIGVIVGVPWKGSLNRIDLVRPPWSSEKIRDAVEKERARLAAREARPAPVATPFSSGLLGAADGESFVSREETQEIQAALPDYVNGLKFYSMAPRYQKLYTMNNGTFHGWQADPLHDEDFKFTLSGGMDAIDRSRWKSVKGLAVPEGSRISVWKEPTDVRAFSLVPRWRWRFPVGTVAVDSLMSGGKLFELRLQSRTEDGWDSHVLKSPENAPAGYHGAGKACISCHQTTGQVMDVPGQIYRRVRWGDDFIFSWRPWKENGQLDYRWPLELK
jgi:hypothetical protein